MSSNDHAQLVNQTFSAEQLAMLDKPTTTSSIHQPLALDPSYITSTRIWREMNNQPKDTNMSMNITEALTEKYLDATHQFALSMVDTINETFTNDDLTACLNCENQLGVEDANSGFDLVECVVYYDLHQQRPCAKLFVNAVVGSRVLLDVYLSAWQLQYYHESISALQSLTMFNVIEANQSNF